MQGLNLLVTQLFVQITVQREGISIAELKFNDKFEELARSDKYDVFANLRPIDFYYA